MRRLWAWLRSPILDPVPEPVRYSALADRFDAVKLILLSTLDEQDRQWPEDRNAEVIDLACEALRVLGVDLVQPAPGEVPIIPGRTS